MYSDGKVYVEEEFEFKYTIETFNDDDNPNLVYTAYTLDPVDGKSLVSVGTFNWMEYVSEERTFRGNPTIDLFGKSYTLFINASDTYSWMMDSFTV